MLLPQDDLVVEHKRKEQLNKYDKFFKKFENSKALDAALDVSKTFSSFNRIEKDESS